MAIAAEIRAHWPRPELTDADAVALGDALDRAFVSPADAIGAIDELLADGERYQPRAPQIIATAVERRERAAAWAPRDDLPQLPRFASMDDDELRASVERVGSIPIRELVGRSIAAIRARGEA